MDWHAYVSLRFILLQDLLTYQSLLASMNQPSTVVSCSPEVLPKRGSVMESLILPCNSNSALVHFAIGPCKLWHFAFTVEGHCRAEHGERPGCSRQAAT